MNLYMLSLKAAALNYSSTFYVSLFFAIVFASGTCFAVDVGFDRA